MSWADGPIGVDLSNGYRMLTFLHLHPFDASNVKYVICTPFYQRLRFLRGHPLALNGCILSAFCARILCLIAGTPFRGWTCEVERNLSSLGDFWTN
jgi:hypothetical protein